jgi:hypothetical protein
MKEPILLLWCREFKILQILSVCYCNQQIDKYKSHRIVQPPTPKPTFSVWYYKKSAVECHSTAKELTKEQKAILFPRSYFSLI